MHDFIAPGVPLDVLRSGIPPHPGPDYEACDPEHGIKWVRVREVRGNRTRVYLKRRPMSAAEIQTALQRGGIEPNPGPRSKRVKIARRSRTRSRSSSRSARSRSGSRVRVVVTKRRRIRSRSAPKKSYLSRLGSLVGGSLAGPPGAKFGSSAGTFLSHITGMGDYKVSSNTFSMGNAVPTFSQTSDGMEVCHTEYLGNIMSSSAFAITAYNIQPGLASTFPWLWNVAANFQEYVMLGCVLHYKPSSGMVTSTNPALGMVIMATEYNVNAANFQTKVQMETSQFCTSTVPFEPMTHPIECARGANLLQTLLVRGGTAPAGGTLQLYDHCRCFVATEGMPAITPYVCGELWISYHIKFKKPIQFFAGQLNQFSHITESPPGTGATTFPLGVVGGVATATSNLSVAKPSNVSPGTTIILPTPGFYKVDYSAASTSGTESAAPSYGLGSNVILVTKTYDDGGSNQLILYNGGSHLQMMSFFVLVTGTDPTNLGLNNITFQASTGGLGYMTDVYVTPMPAGFT